MLLDRYGNPLRQPMPLQKSIYRDMRQDVWTGITPDKLAELFRSADDGRLDAIEELFSAIWRIDAQVRAGTDRRVDEINSLTESLVPASTSDIDTSVCNFVRNTLRTLPGWNDAKVALNFAIVTGVKVVEFLWGKKDGMIVPVATKILPIRCLNYLGDDGSLLDWPLYLDNDSVSGIPLPRRNVVLHTGNDLIEHPTRLGLYRPVAWMAMLKAYGIREFGRLCDKFGIPWLLAKYAPYMSSNDKQNLFDILGSFGNLGYGMVPDSSSIEVFESNAVKAGTTPQEAMIAFADSQISKVLTTGNLLLDSSDNGSRAHATVMQEGFEGVSNSDGMRLAGSIQNQLIKHIVELNFPKGTKVPSYILAYPNQEDYKAKADWLEPVVDRAPLDEGEYYRQYGLQPPAPGARTVGGDGGGFGFSSRSRISSASRRMPKNPQKQAEGHQKIIDKLILRASQREMVKREIKENGKKIANVVQSSNDYQEAQRTLGKMSRSMSMESYQDAVASSMLSAKMLGIKSVKSEMKNNE